VEVAGVSSDGNLVNRKPQRKKRWDAVLVGIGMTVAFSIVITRLTGLSACDAVDALQMTDAGCASWLEGNWNALMEWLKDSGYYPVRLP
jgi:hypothetical protein